MKTRPPPSSAIAKGASVPLVADIHFHYKRGIEAAEAGAACLRINPGNIGSPDRVKEVVSAARNNGCSIRIGVNGGSLEKAPARKIWRAMPRMRWLKARLDHARILDDLGFHDYKISVKASDMFLAVAAYQQLAEATDAPLHLGITEAGGRRIGTVKIRYRHGQPALDGNWRHDPRLTLGRPRLKRSRSASIC